MFIMLSVLNFQVIYMCMSFMCFLFIVLLSERRVNLQHGGNDKGYDAAEHYPHKEVGIADEVGEPTGHHARKHHAERHERSADGVDGSTLFATGKVYEVEHIGCETEAVAELLDEDAGIDDKHVGILCAAEIYVDKVGNRNAQHHGPQPFLQSSAGHEETAEQSAEGETENAYSAVDETNLLGGKAETAILYVVEHEGVDNLDKLSLGKTEEQHEEQGGDDLRFAEENLQGADKLAQLRTYIWFYGGMNVFDLRKGETVVEVHAKEKDGHDKERGGPGKRYIAGNAVST